jgi:hypothetical protein
VKELLQDERLRNLYPTRVPPWLASDGGQIKYDINDSASLSFNIKEVPKKNSTRRISIVIDVLSSLLMLNPLTRCIEA